MAEIKEEKKKGGRPRKVTKKMLKRAIDDSNGAAKGDLLKLLKISTRTLARCFERWPDMEEYYEAAYESRQWKKAAMADRNVWNALATGDLPTSKWFLTNSKVGKELGYGPRSEHTGKDGGALDIAIEPFVDNTPISERGEE